MRTFIIFSLLTVLAFACSDDNENDPQEDTICAVFDMRQCNGNPWLEDEIQLPASSADHKQAVKDYLTSEGIAVNDVTIDAGFHQVACLACFVCPAGPRYYIETIVADTAAIRDLELLNLGFNVGCGK